MCTLILLGIYIMGWFVVLSFGFQSGWVEVRELILYNQVWGLGQTRSYSYSRVARVPGFVWLRIAE